MTAAKLIAPAIEATFAAGFDWFVLRCTIFITFCMESRHKFSWLQVKISHKQPLELHVGSTETCYLCTIELHFSFLCASFFRSVDVVKSSQYTDLADDLEIIKAVTYLRQKDFNQVIVWTIQKSNPTQVNQAVVHYCPYIYL